MSIQLAALGREIAKEVPLPPSAGTIWASALVLGWLLLAYLAAKLLGAFRRRSIVGPPRLGPDETVWILVFLFFAGACIAVFLSNLINRFLPAAIKTNLIVESAIIEALAVVAIVVCFHFLRPRGIRLLGLRLIQIPRGIALGATTLFIVFPIVLVVGVVTQALINWAGLPTPTHEVLQELGKPQTGPVFFITIALAVVGAPLAEELAFRGILQTVVGRGLSWMMDSTDAPSPGSRARWTAVIITAVLFAAVHHELAFFPPLFVLALGLGYLYERTGNLWAAIAMHALFNGVEIVLFLGTLPHASR